MTVASSPVVVSGTDWMKFSGLTNGRRRREMRIRGIILSAVRMVSATPENTIPAIFSPQKTERTAISIPSTGPGPK
jgi:hypothetical protein